MESLERKILNSSSELESRSMKASDLIFELVGLNAKSVVNVKLPANTLYKSLYAINKQWTKHLSSPHDVLLVLMRLKEMNIHDLNIKSSPHVMKNVKYQQFLISCSHLSFPQ